MVERKCAWGGEMYDNDCIVGVVWCVLVFGEFGGAIYGLRDR